MTSALLRYRVIAWVVGVGLVVLVLVGVPLKYAADQPAVVAVVGPVHGFLYIVYLLCTLDLAIRSRWPVPKTLLVMLAGTVPFLSFVAERVVTHQERSRVAARARAARRPYADSDRARASGEVTSPAPRPPTPAP